MLIRPGIPADVFDLMKLERRSPAAAHWSPEKYQTFFSTEVPRRVLLVLEGNDGIQGFIVGRALDTEWEIENIVVCESLRRHGFGTRLLHEFLALARNRGAEKVYLEVRESNLPARQLYEKLTFSECGRRHSYYREPREDAIVYQLGLA